MNQNSKLLQDIKFIHDFENKDIQIEQEQDDEDFIKLIKLNRCKHIGIKRIRMDE